MFTLWASANNAVLRLDEVSVIASQLREHDSVLWCQEQFPRWHKTSTESLTIVMYQNSLNLKELGLEFWEQKRWPHTNTKARVRGTKDPETACFKVKKGALKLFCKVHATQSNRRSKTTVTPFHPLIDIDCPYEHLAVSRGKTRISARAGREYFPGNLTCVEATI